MNATPQRLHAIIAALLLVSPALAASLPEEPRSSAQVVKVLRIPRMDRAPTVLKKIYPAYPFELRQEGIQGMVTVDMLVDSTGRVVAVDLVKTTEPALNACVLAAAKEWQFTPASAAGQAVSTRVRVPFEFSMPRLLAKR